MGKQLTMATLYKFGKLWEIPPAAARLGKSPNFMKERWAASYNPARKVTYVSWFLGTIAYFLDKLDFTTLVSPPVETKYPVFIAEPPSAPLDPAPPPCNQAPVTSSSSAASRNPGQPIAPAAPAVKPVRKSRIWNAGGPAALAALEQRRAAERQAQLRHAPREVSSGFARTRNNPDEGTGGLVVIRDEGVDVLDEFRTAPEGLTIERLFGKDREPDFDLV
jgi:hypothetical protein